MPHPLRLLIFSSSITLLIVVSFAIVAYNASNNENREIVPKITLNLEKISLINELSTITQSQVGMIHAVFLEGREQFSDNSWLKFSQLKGRFTRTKDRLQPLLSLQELEIMSRIDQMNNEMIEFNHQVSLLLLNGSRNQAQEILLKEVLPRHDPLIEHLTALTQAQKLDVEQVILQSNNRAERAQTRIIMFAGIAIIVSLFMSAITIMYGKKFSKQLEDMNSYLEQKIHDSTESLLDTQKELIEDNNELTRLALNDSLTGLPNRAQMNQILHSEYSRFERYNQKFGVVMIDIDNFKEVNDSFGHDIGDNVLIELANLFQKSIRNSDYISRWGGEEFLLCCPMTSNYEIFHIAETLRQLISNAAFEKIKRITISLGCAAIAQRETISDLIKRADVALYESKFNGRNLSTMSEHLNIVSE